MASFNKWEHLVLKGEFERRDKILLGLTLEQVTKKPAEGLHTIYDELWHVTRWQDIVINNDKELEKKWYQKEILPLKQAESQQEWDELVKKFVDTLNRIIEFTKSPEKLSEKGDDDIPIEDYLYALIMHNTYHLAKIVALRQMMGLWPPKEEIKK